MRVSKSFLNEYIDIKDIPMAQIAAKMVLAGNEYESVCKLSEATGLVVGEILECKKHPDSTKLSICKVNVGTELQILCGAPNVSQAKKVIVAKIGAKLPDGLEIKAAKLAGMDSQGMICSLSELGIESKYQTEEDKNGIHVLADDAPVGVDAVSYLGFDDEVIDFELTSNRSDLLNILGMAYEVGALYDLKVTEPTITFNEISSINDTHTLKVETDKCPIYLGKLAKNVTIKESPKFIKNRLMASGIRPINNVVDISNYVMLEYGNPLHFFDGDKLGTNITVRMASDETLTTLDGINRNLSNEDIIITDGQKPVALAGVMGGLETEITENTKDIFIESAIFNSYNIRYTSKRILKSEASSRYEKGIDPNRTVKALNRACQLLEKYADAQIVGGILTHDVALKEPKIINLSLEKVNSILGLTLTTKDIDKVLNSLGFTYEYNNEYIITVPTRRLDVNIKEDIIEEIGRIHGYDKVVGNQPKLQVKQGNYSKKARIIKSIRSKLNGLGLNQVITYSLTNEKSLTRFVNEQLTEVKLIDPMSEDKKYLRLSLINGLLNVYEYNKSRNINDINIFEIGSIYSKPEKYVEETKIAGLLSGNYLINNWQNKTIEIDFYLVKGIIENLLSYLGFNNRYTFKEEVLKDMHNGRSAAIYVDNNRIGYLGQVHPNISKNPVYVFEISLDTILELKVRNIKFKEISKYPSVSKDLAFVVKKDIKSSEIAAVIKKTGGKLLTNIDVFDVYDMGENKSLAYSLTFADTTRTLNDEEVTELFNKIINTVETELDAKLRK